MTTHPYIQIPELGGAERIVHDGPVTWNIGETGLPFADTSIIDFENSHRHYDATFEWMDLDEFMEIQHRIYLANVKVWNGGHPRNPERVLNYTDYWSKTVHRDTVYHLIELMEKGTVFDALVIELDKNGKLMDFQEGRHRAATLKELGIPKLPVWILRKRF